jgi:hypothetical protein
MTRIRTNFAVFILVGGVCLSGNQSALTKIGITVKDVQTWATQVMIESTDVEGSIIRYRVPCVSPSAVKVLQLMTPAERLALTQEVLAAAKAAVSTPAFKAEHARYVKQTRNAIDHGIADTAKLGLTGNTNADAIRTVIVPIIDMLRTAPFDGLKQSYEGERNDLKDTIKNETGEEKAKAQKYLARLDAIAPLLKTNPEEFRKQYTLAKSASLGGPDTETTLQAMTASREDTEKLRVEQNQWNHWNLNEVIKKSLVQVIDYASKVQPGVAYACDNKSLNANYNRGSLDALMNLMGAGPTNAGAQFARAWLKELGR